MKTKTRLFLVGLFSFGIGSVFGVGITVGLKLEGVRDSYPLQRQMATGALHYFREFGEYPPLENRAFVRAMSGENPSGILFIAFEEEDLNEDGIALDYLGRPIEISRDDNRLRFTSNEKEWRREISCYTVELASEVSQIEEIPKTE